MRKQQSITQTVVPYLADRAEEYAEKVEREPAGRGHRPPGQVGIHQGAVTQVRVPGVSLQQGTHIKPRNSHRGTWFRGSAATGNTLYSREKSPRYVVQGFRCNREHILHKGTVTQVRGPGVPLKQGTRITPGNSRPGTCSRGSVATGNTYYTREQSPRYVFQGFRCNREHSMVHLTVTQNTDAEQSRDS